MDSLPIFVTLAGRTVVLVGDGPAADAKRRLIEAAGATVVDTPRPDTRLAFVALDDEAAAAAAAARLRAAGCLVNVVDRPALCDFTVPAIVDRSPVIVAVGTGGASATLAKALRQRIEALLPPRLGNLAAALRAGRDAIAGRYPDPAARRAFLDAAMDDDGPLDPLRVHADPAATLRTALDGGAPPVDGVVEIVLGSRDPDRLMLWQVRALATADVVLAGPGVPPEVLARARRDAARGTYDGKPVAGGSGRTVIVVLAWRRPWLDRPGRDRATSPE